MNRGIYQLAAEAASESSELQSWTNRCSYYALVEVFLVPDIQDELLSKLGDMLVDIPDHAIDRRANQDPCWLIWPIASIPRDIVDCGTNRFRHSDMNVHHRDVELTGDVNLALASNAKNQHVA